MNKQDKKRGGTTKCQVVHLFECDDFKKNLKTGQTFSIHCQKLQNLTKYSWYSLLCRISQYT